MGSPRAWPCCTWLLSPLSPPCQLSLDVSPAGAPSLSLALPLGCVHPRAARLHLQLPRVKPVLSFPSRDLGRAERDLWDPCVLQDRATSGSAASSLAFPLQPMHRRSSDAARELRRFSAQCLAVENVFL